MIDVKASDSRNDRGGNEKIKIVNLNEALLPLCSKWAANPQIDASIFAPLAKSAQHAAQILSNPKLKIRVILVGETAVGYLSAREVAANSFDSPPCMEIGILIGPSQLRGKGIGTQALKLFLDELFSDSSVHRVQAVSDAANEQIRALLTKLGFKQEGVLREFTYRNKQWRDEAVYGLLNYEYNSLYTIS